MSLRLLGWAHGGLVHTRRVRALARALAERLPQGARVLDVGCGDGLLAAAIGGLRPDLAISGLDVLVRPQAAIPVKAFDGLHIPDADGSYDCVMACDVLHHADDIPGLLAEMARVSRRWVLLKDHYAEDARQRALLAFMDWVGNRAHGVSLPYRYLSRDAWGRLYQACGLRVAAQAGPLGLYPAPFHRVFENGLHHVTLLEKASQPVQPPFQS